MVGLVHDTQREMLRAQFDEALLELRATHPGIRRRALAHYAQSLKTLGPRYRLAWPLQRWLMMAACRRRVVRLWDTDRWPVALGLCLACFVLKAEALDGEDGARMRQALNHAIDLQGP